MNSVSRLAWEGKRLEGQEGGRAEDKGIGSKQGSEIGRKSARKVVKTQRNRGQTWGNREKKEVVLTGAGGRGVEEEGEGWWEGAGAGGESEEARALPGAARAHLLHRGVRREGRGGRVQHADEHVEQLGCVPARERAEGACVRVRACVR
eukprot:6180998-Pleurochrysis_carterae.AAC.1